MFRATIHATEQSDVAAEVSALRTKCDRAGLAPMLVDILAKQVGDMLTDLVSKGQTLSGMGSQMQVTREISDDAYSITVQFGAGVRRSWLQRIADALRGR